jgi:hypothetical protein
MFFYFYFYAMHNAIKIVNNSSTLSLNSFLIGHFINESALQAVL